MDYRGYKVKETTAIGAFDVPRHEKDYWCRNCGQVYTLKGLRPIRLAPSPAVAQKLRSAEKHRSSFTRKIGRTTNESV